MVWNLLIGSTFIFGNLLTVFAPSIRVSFLDISVVGLSLWTLFRYRWEMGKPPFRPAIFFVGVSVSLVGLRYVLGVPQYPLSEMLYIARWASYAALFPLFLSVPLPRLKTAIATLFWCGVVMAGTGLVQVVVYPYLRNLWYVGWDPHLNRVFSTLFDPNFSGILFVLTLVLGGSMHRTRLWWIGMAITVVALLLTYSRSSYIAGMISIIVYFGMKRSGKVGVIALCLFLGAVILAPRGSEGQNILRMASTTARLGSTIVGWQRFLSAPFVGTGFIHHTDETAVIARTNGVDMSLLYIASSVGLIGLSVYLFVLVGWMRIVRGHPLAVSSLTAVMVHSLFTNSLLYPFVMAWIWLILAAVKRGAMADR